MGASNSGESLEDVTKTMFFSTRVKSEKRSSRTENRAETVEPR